MLSNKFNLLLKAALSLVINLCFIATAYAIPAPTEASFTIAEGEEVTLPQNLADNHTGTIEVGGQLNTGLTAINAIGVNNIIKISGDITTTEGSAYGIKSSGDNASINNNGSISTIGRGARGIHSSGAGATISNSGSISTAGDVAFGIVSVGAGAIITNSGGISTTGRGANGILSTGAGAIITNSGSISTTGNRLRRPTRGIVSSGADTTITNSGSISTAGDVARGIVSSGADATINNGGLISATGLNASAILGGSNDITLNLLPGSQIIGAIDLGSAADNDTANVYGGSASANLTFLNTEVINLFGAGVVVDNTVMTVDATAESSRSVILSGLTSSVHNVVSQRMAQAKALKPVQVASLELAPGMLFQERAPVAWAQVFGGQFDRNGDSSSLGYETDHEGFAAGYEWDNNKTRVGLMGGVAQSDTKSDISSFQTDVNSYFVGAYGHFNLGSVNLTASVLTGYADHDNERLVVDNINGLEVARSDVSSTFLSPSLTLSSAFSASDTVELRPSATISYSVAWMDDYKEKGTTSSNLSVGDRTLETLSARLQLAAAYQLNQASELELRIGVNSRDSDDDNTHASISGNGFSYSSVGDDSVTGGFAGANIRLAGMDNLSFVADVEYGESSDEDSLTGSLSLNYTF